MTLQSWLMYFALVLVATSTPGPAVLYIMTNATMYGWKKSIFAALGNITGLFLLGVIAVVGLGAVLKASVLLFTLVKYGGAAYLIYLGVKMIRSTNTDFGKIKHQYKSAERSSRKTYFQALGIAVSNPKAIVFLTALFPQFISAEVSLFPQFAILIITLMAFSFFFLMLYALLAHSAKNWLNKPNRMQVVNKTSGGVFIGFGCLLASSSN